MRQESEDEAKEAKAHERRMRQDQAEREEKTRQENEDEAKEAKAHERRLENARRRKELEAAETGAETQVATKDHAAPLDTKVKDQLPAQASKSKAPTPLPESKQYFAFLSHKKVKQTCYGFHTRLQLLCLLHIDALQ